MQSSSVSGSGRPGKHIEDGARYEYNFMNRKKLYGFQKKGMRSEIHPASKKESSFVHIYI